MRKLVLLVLACSMLIAGLSAFVFEAWFAKVIFFRFIIGGAVIAFAGAYLLWCDFIAPKLGIKSWED